LITGTIFDVKKFSIHDGPGIRTTIFFKGCPLTCLWCHNPESQASEPELMFLESRCIGCGMCREVCDQGAISEDLTVNAESCTLCGECVEACYAEARQMVGQEMTVAQVMAEVERDVPFYDESGGGVTFSGGEPLAQPDFLLALLRACREREIHTALDTCGFAPWQVLDRVRRHTDLFLYDLKLMAAAAHQKFTGVSNELILRNLQMLSERGHDIILRLPIVPGVNDDEQIRRTGEFAAALPHLNRVDVLPYHHSAAQKYERLGRPYQLPTVQPPSEARVAKIIQILQAFDLQVRTGG